MNGQNEPTRQTNSPIFIPGKASVFMTVTPPPFYYILTPKVAKGQDSRGTREPLLHSDGEAVGDKESEHTQALNATI